MLASASDSSFPVVRHDSAIRCGGKTRKVSEESSELLDTSHFDSFSNSNLFYS